MARDPQTVAQRWRDNLSAASQKIAEGVQGVTKNPMETAAQRKDKWIAGVQRAATEGRWEAGLRKTTLQDWQTAMINRGLPRIAQGASEATQDFASFMADFLPYANSVSQKVQAMPSVTLEQNIARAVEAIRSLSQYRRK